MTVSETLPQNMIRGLRVFLQFLRIYAADELEKLPILGGLVSAWEQLSNEAEGVEQDCQLAEILRRTPQGEVSLDRLDDRIDELLQVVQLTRRRLCRTGSVP